MPDIHEEIVRIKAKGEEAALVTTISSIGLEIDAQTPEEIALSIPANVVEVRRSPI